MVNAALAGFEVVRKEHTGIKDREPESLAGGLPNMELAMSTENRSGETATTVERFDLKNAIFSLTRSVVQATGAVRISNDW